MSEAVPQRPGATDLLTPAEVAALFRVDPKTVTRWAKSGKLTSIRTLGGHRRYRSSEVYSLLAGAGSAGPGDVPDRGDREDQGIHQDRAARQDRTAR
ncbi:MAG: helix-turn-helix domain-containing protein [Actinomycetota bacterium]|nr:MAG: helix-turn-helix domain-containing protein [Actinomycetota bacterium]